MRGVFSLSLSLSLSVSLSLSPLLPVSLCWTTLAGSPLCAQPLGEVKDHIHTAGPRWKNNSHKEPVLRSTAVCSVRAHHTGHSAVGLLIVACVRGDCLKDNGPPVSTNRPLFALRATMRVIIASHLLEYAVRGEWNSAIPGERVEKRFVLCAAVEVSGLQCPHRARPDAQTHTDTHTHTH